MVHGPGARHSDVGSVANHADQGAGAKWEDPHEIDIDTEGTPPEAKNDDDPEEIDIDD